MQFKLLDISLAIYCLIKKKTSEKIYWYRIIVDVIQLRESLFLASQIRSALNVVLADLDVIIRACVRRWGTPAHEGIAGSALQARLYTLGWVIFLFNCLNDIDIAWTLTYKEVGLLN